MVRCTSIYMGLVPYILFQGMSPRSRPTDPASNNRQHIYQQLLLTSRQHELLLTTPHFVKLLGGNKCKAPEASLQSCLFLWSGRISGHHQWYRCECVSSVDIREGHALQFQKHHTFDTCHLSTIRSHNLFLCYCTVCTHNLVMAACFLVHTDVHVFSMEILTGSNQTSSLRSSALCSIVKFLQGLFVTYRNMCFLFASGLMFPQSIGTPSTTKISPLNPWKTAPAGPLILLHLVASKCCLGQALIMSSFRLPCHRSTSLQPPFRVATPFLASPNIC